MADTVPHLHCRRRSTRCAARSEGKSYWQRVWERLRARLGHAGRDAAILALLLDHGRSSRRGSRCTTPTGVGPAAAEAGRLSRPLARHRRGRPRLWSRMVYGGRLSLLAGIMPVVPGAAGRRLSRHPRRLSGGLVNSAIMRRWTCSTPSRRSCWRSRSRHPRRRARQHDPGADHRLHPAARAHLGGGHDAGAAPRLRRGGAGERRRTLHDHPLPHPQQRAGPILVYATSLISVGIILAAGLSFPRSRRHAAERRMGADAEQAAPGDLGRPGDLPRCRG